ncbi:transcription initiation protein, partial [Salmonella enterica subsp. enterica]|nr:transcription initiation protein [Salmonella enterica subsp. enterica serovar Typhimurium]
MQFLMIISHDDSFRPTESLIENIHAWIVGMEQKGIRVYGNPLQPASDAVTVRIRNGEENIATGPFSDSKEQMCGYELIECKD